MRNRLSSGQYSHCRGIGYGIKHGVGHELKTIRPERTKTRTYPDDHDAALADPLRGDGNRFFLLAERFWMNEKTFIRVCFGGVIVGDNVYPCTRLKDRSPDDARQRFRVVHCRELVRLPA